MSDAAEFATGFLIPVFGTDFWYVFHWRNAHDTHSRKILTENQYQFLAHMTCSLVPNFSGTRHYQFSITNTTMLCFRASLLYQFSGVGSGGSGVFMLGGHWGGDTFIWGGTQLILSC